MGKSRWGKTCATHALAGSGDAARAASAAAGVTARGRCGSTAGNGRSSHRSAPRRLGAVAAYAPAVCGEGATAAERGVAGVRGLATAPSPPPLDGDVARRGWSLCPCRRRCRCRRLARSSRPAGDRIVRVYSACASTELGRQGSC